MRRLCKSPVVFLTEASDHSCLLASPPSALKVVVESCKTNSPIAVAKATLRIDPPYNVCRDTVTLDSNKGKVITDTLSRHKLCQCIGVCNFEKVNGSSSGDYGFVPLQTLGKIIDKGANLGLNMGYVDLHKQFGHLRIPNCVGSQYSIPTDLNISLWEELLTGNRHGIHSDNPASRNFVWRLEYHIIFLVSVMISH